MSDKEKNQAYDKKDAEEFMKRFFQIQKEKKMLAEDEKELKEEFKGKVPVQIVKKVMQLVKIKKALEYEVISEETLDELEDLVTDNYVTIEE